MFRKGLRPSASLHVVLSYMNVSHYNSQRCLQEMALSRIQMHVSHRGWLSPHSVVGIDATRSSVQCTLPGAITDCQEPVLHGTATDDHIHRQFAAPSANHRHGRCWQVASCFGRMHGFQYTMGSFAPEGARTAAFCGAERFPHRWSDPQLPIAAVQLRPLSDVRIDSYTPPTRVFSRSMAVPTLLGGHHPSPQLWMMSSTALVMA